MLIDRDPWIDAFYNVSNFEAEGLPVDARWDSHYMAGEPPFWIDPKGDGLGEGAAYFKYNPEEAIKMIEAAGFKLVDRSEINANPKDTKDYEKGVWTLPPNFTLGDVDRAKYAAIGESDRFTLKFVKPAR